MFANSVSVSFHFGFLLSRYTLLCNVTLIILSSVTSKLTIYEHFVHYLLFGYLKTDHLWTLRQANDWYSHLGCVLVLEKRRTPGLVTLSPLKSCISVTSKRVMLCTIKTNRSNKQLFCCRATIFAGGVYTVTIEYKK